MGYRDSELAVLVDDEERVPSRMNGEEYEAGPLALALRKECFRCDDLSQKLFRDVEEMI